MFGDSQSAQILPFMAPEDENMRFDPTTGKWEVEVGDGSLLIYDHDPRQESDERSESEHEENLAELLDEMTLSDISADVLDGIEEDDRSRAEWLNQRSKALDMLGLKIEAPHGDAGSSPLAGMSTVRHPLLLEACMRYQSNAIGEMLPADGPVKGENNGLGTVDGDALAKTLEDACNMFLTDTAKEYYPDTDRMFFQEAFSGAGFKKGYHCPLRRRPVIEAVDAKDLIVNNSATSLSTASRITHVIKMAPSTLKRMQIAGAYRDVSVALPDEESTQLDYKLSTLQGVSRGSTRPKDMDHTIYECHCDLEIPGYEHKLDGKKTGLPIPYKVVIDKSSRKILEIRRNYKEHDEMCVRKRCFVMYPLVPMFGFYPSGFLHILGNTENSLTAAWRIILDNGMYNNFPVWLYKKGGTKNENPTFRSSPGTGIPIDSIDGKLSDSVMPVPYKETNPAFTGFIDNVAQAGQRLGGTMEVQVGEGKQDAPVGTTLALIEQATKIMMAIHKRQHTAQSEEFQMLRELLREDPEALWRHRPDGQRPANADLILQALENCDIIPVADPNTPSNMHRLMKVAALAQRADLHPDRYDAVQVETEVMRGIGWDNPERFLAKAPPQVQPDPATLLAMSTMETAKIRGNSAVQAAQIKAQQADLDRQVKVAGMQQQAKLKAAELASRERTAAINVAQRLAVHPQSQRIIQGAGQS